MIESLNIIEIIEIINSTYEPKTAVLIKLNEIPLLYCAVYLSRSGLFVV